MNSMWDSITQWLYSVGLHPGGAAVDRASSVVRDSASEVVTTVEQAASGMDMSSLLALAAALGWASGFRLYIVVFLVGALGASGLVDLPGGLHVLEHPAMLFASGGLLFVEFFADKIPGIDSLWDLLQSVLRVPAGAALAASVFGADNATMAAVAALMGGTLAATSHVAKATTRAAANTSPEPFSNIGLSLLGDAGVPLALWLSWQHPLVFFVALLVALALMVALIVVLGKFLRALLRRVAGWMRPRSA